MKKNETVCASATFIYRRAFLEDETHWLYKKIRARALCMISLKLEATRRAVE
jgi:hypothetical protein